MKKQRILTMWFMSFVVGNKVKDYIFVKYYYSKKRGYMVSILKVISNKYGIFI